MVGERRAHLRERALRQTPLVRARQRSPPASAGPAFLHAPLVVINNFGGADDPLVPDWQNLEKTGVLPKLREARAAIYAPGSLPKLCTALNHWLHFTATKARVRTQPQS